MFMATEFAFLYQYFGFWLLYIAWPSIYLGGHWLCHRWEGLL
ncbi:hypothetical protein JCM19240_1708 [Vibrio maritimus]|uniref:Uncharacterized protein n=1 Tax=Vibrio maritimus TaxID=990268 RepID=A0A090TBX7_9VIBR|nr:hypothetical protein JCM19240_1708 [Vibrio maritimus]